MKTSDVDFEFPVLGFTENKDIWGFPDLNTLTSCGPITLKENLQDGMELIDARGKRWRVESIRRTGRGRPLLRWLFDAVLSTRQSRIEHELTELDPVTLAEAKQRTCEAINAFAENYCAEDERDTVLEPLLAQVRAAADIGSLYELLQPDSFMSY